MSVCPALQEPREGLEEGEEWRNNTTGCCPKYTRTCVPSTCPTPVPCPLYYKQYTENKTITCCAQIKCGNYKIESESIVQRTKLKSTNFFIIKYIFQPNFPAHPSKFFPFPNIFLFLVLSFTFLSLKLSFSLYSPFRYKIFYSSLSTLLSDFLR